MDTTVALTGLLPFVVTVASLLALPVSLVLLRLYRRSVLAGMAAAAGAAPAPPTEPGPPPAQRLRIEAVDRVDETPLAQQARHAPWRAWAAVAAGGLAYAAVMTVGWLLATRDAHVPLVKLLLLGWTYLWPLVLAAGLVAAFDARQRVALALGYGMIHALITAWALQRNPQMGALELPLFWLITNGPVTVLTALVMLRKVRAVGPMVLALLLMATLGSQVLVALGGGHDTVLRGLVTLGGAIGLGGTGTFYAVMLLGLLLFGVLAWPLLRVVGRRYEARRFSDQFFTLAALWLMFGVVQSIGLAFEGPWWILTGLVAYAAWHAVTALAARHALPRPQAPRTLLLLRVFRLGARSEGLFDRLRAHWLPLGPMRMIAGPDLATSAVEPHEFLEFLSGRLGRQFVAGDADLARRLAAVPPGTDPDGRHRVHEFFCRADTWQSTMQRLAADSAAVLMDLRSFAPANQGCTWELGRLLDGVPLQRVLLLVDASTDRAFLEATLQRLWQQLAAGSPNRGGAAPVLRVLAIERPDAAAMRSLLGALLR